MAERIEVPARRPLHELTCPGCGWGHQAPVDFQQQPCVACGFRYGKPYDESKALLRRIAFALDRVLSSLRVNA